MFARASKFQVIDRRAELEAIRKARPNDAVARLRRVLGIDVLFLEEFIEARHHMIACNDIWMHYLVVDPFSKYGIDVQRDHGFLAAYTDQTKRWVHTIQHGTLDEGYFDELALLTAFYRKNSLPMALLENGVRAACEKTLVKTKYTKAESYQHLRQLSERCLLKLLTLSTHVISRSYTLWQDAYTSQTTFSFNPEDIEAAEFHPTHADTQIKTISHQSLPSHLQGRNKKRLTAQAKQNAKKAVRAGDVRPWSMRKKT